MVLSKFSSAVCVVAGILNAVVGVQGSALMALTPTAPTKIVGGVPADVTRFPYFAAVIIDSAEGTFVCGGTLVSPSVVMTAAHCVEDDLSAAALAQLQVTVGFGCQSILSGTCDQVASVDVQTIQVLDTNLQKDFALMTLTSAIQGITPVQLSGANLNVSDGFPVTVVGNGATKVNGNLPDGLREVEVEIVNHDVCNVDYQIVLSIQNNLATVSTDEVINDFMICAAETRKDSCQGDSGGPLLLKCDSAETDIQIGVVSFGIGCAYDGIPGVYAKVSNPEAVQFIQTYVTNAGETVTFVDSFEEFCVQNGTSEPTPAIPAPNSFPTFSLDAWTCDGATFAAGDGCNCGCGIQDPDCEFDSKAIGCGSLQSCNSEGKCTGITTGAVVGIAVGIAAFIGIGVVLAVHLSRPKPKSLETMGTPKPWDDGNNYKVQVADVAEGN